MDILQNMMDASSHAIFTMDRDGIVTHINRQAKERFGLFNHSVYAHPAGRLQKGDLVILATSAMGLDDGNLTAADLQYIGIHDGKIHRGDMVIAIGIYGEEAVKPLYKYIRAGSGDALKLAATFQGIPIVAAIENNEITVEVRGRFYSISYFKSIGQMVVLDRYTRQVKFWEEKGYSARKEGIGDLLRRGSFIGKSADTEILVVGYYFREFFEGDKFERHLEDILTGKALRYEDQEYDINGFELSATLLPITGDGGSVEGIIVKFRNIEDIRVTIMERNAAIRTAERKYREIARDSSGEDQLDGILGNSPATVNARRYTRKLAQLDCPVLICGEPGTGKSRVIQSILQTQKRQGAVVAMDCTAVSAERLSHILLDENGALNRAEGGTLVLEEISALPPDLQRLILGVIQNRRIEGEGESHPADVRVLAVTAADLREKMQAGQFRSDLYYRLAAFRIELPPLRAGREDIPFIANELMEKLRNKYGKPDTVLSGESFGLLMAYDWPGNIRELENVLERALILSDGDLIYPEHLSLEAAPVCRSLKDRLRQAERHIIEQTLIQCEGDRKAAMEQLGISRTTFYEKLRDLNIR